MLLGATLALTPLVAGTADAPSPKAADPKEYVVTPEKGSKITKPEFTFAFPNATDGQVVPDREDGFEFTSTDYSVYIEDYTVTEVEGADCPTFRVVFDCSGVNLTDGSYTLKLYPWAFEVNGGNLFTVAQLLDYEIEGSGDTGDQFTYQSVEPADGESITELSEVVVNFKYGTLVYNFANPVDPSKVHVLKAGSTEPIAADDIVLFDIEDEEDLEQIAPISFIFTDPVTEPGKYTLTIDEGAFVNMMTGDFIGEKYTSTFTIGAAADPTEYTLTPEPGTEISDPTLTIAFPNATTVTNSSFKTITLSNGSNEIEYKATKVNTNVDCPTFTLAPRTGVQKLPSGDYDFSAEEGAFNIDGTPSPAITKAYKYKSVYGYTLTPAPETGLTLDKVEFTIAFPNAAGANITFESDWNVLYKSDGNGGYTEFSDKFTVTEVTTAECPTYTIVYSGDNLEDGDYKLEINTRAFTINGFAYEPDDVNVTFTLATAAPADPKEYVVTPAKGSKITKPEFTFAFPNAKDGQIVPNEVDGFEFTTSSFSVRTEDYTVTKVEGADCPTFIVVPDCSEGTLVNGPCTLTMYWDAFKVNGENLLSNGSTVEFKYEIEGLEAEHFDLFKVEPENGATVSDLTKVTVYINAMDAMYGGLTLAPNPDNDELPWLDAISITKEGSSNAIHPVDYEKEEEESKFIETDDYDYYMPIYFTLADPITEPGKYTISIAEGAFVMPAGGGGGILPLNNEKDVKAAPKAAAAFAAISNAYTGTFTIEAAEPEPTYIPFGKVVPAEGDVFKQLDKVTVYADIEAPLMPADMVDLGAVLKAITIVKEGSTVEIHPTDVGEGGQEDDYMTMPFVIEPPITEAGTYTLTITQGSFVQTIYGGGAIADEDEDNAGPVFNKEYTCTFTIDPTAKGVLDDYVISPESGVVESISEVYVTFPQLELMSPLYNLSEEAGATISDGKTTYAVMGMMDSDFEDGKRFVLTFYDENDEVVKITEAGKWTLTIPVGAFKLGNESNPLITAEYTIEEAAAEVKYTISPEDGATLTENPEIIITFPGAKEVTLGENWDFNLSLMNEDMTWGPWFNEPEEVEVADGVAVKLTYDGVTPNGKLNFRANEGVFIVDGVESPEIVAHYVMKRVLSHEVMFEPEEIIEINPYWNAAEIYFDEGATVDLTDASKVVVKFNDTVLTAGTHEGECGYIIGVENNWMSIQLTNPDLFEAGVLSVYIPGSAYTFEGEEGFDIEHSWTLVIPKNYTYTITPNIDNTTVASLKEILITFTNAESVEVENEGGVSINKTDYSKWYDTKAEIVENDGHPACKITLDEPITEAGEYRFTVGYGTFKIDGISYFPDRYIEKIFTVDPIVGVDMVWDGSSNVTVISVDGKVLYKDAPANVVKTLDNGIYIINGKKVFIKK